MAGKTVILACETKQVIEKMGNRIKKARLRRNIMAEDLVKQVGISKGTLSSIEKGETTVSLGAYVVVLEALGMADDFEFIAIDDEGKQIYSDLVLKQRKRAAKRNNEK